jgi:hypothetical protein
MCQNPPPYVPVPRRRPFIVLLPLPFLLFGLTFFCGSSAIEPDPDIEVLPGLAFVDAGGVAVGAAAGHVLVQRSVTDTGMALSVVLPDNGQVADTLTIEHVVLRAVTDSYATTTAVATGPELAMARGDLGATTRPGARGHGVADAP